MACKGVHSLNEAEQYPGLNKFVPEILSKHSTWLRRIHHIIRRTVAFISYSFFDSGDVTLFGLAILIGRRNADRISDTDNDQIRLLIDTDLA